MSISAAPPATLATADPPHQREQKRGGVRTVLLTGAGSVGGVDEGHAALVRRVEQARRDPGVVVLEGFHAVKHALRFGARVELLLTPDAERLAQLVDGLAPDLAPLHPEAVDPDVWDTLTRGGLPSPALGVCARPTVDVADLLAAPGSAPVVLLEAPTHLGNIGAAIRVAAAAGAGGVLTTGDADPWHPAAVRGGAGLQLALPVARVPSLPETDRPVVAFDAGGTTLGEVAVPPRSLLCFGTERRGCSRLLLERADLIVGIPMRLGVSSLNLATSVAVALYSGDIVDGTPSRRGGTS